MNKLFLITLQFMACVILQAQQSSLTLLSNMPYAEGLSSLWGYEAPDGTEYAVIGTTTRVSIVSLADPANPIEVASIPGPNTSWREAKVWSHYAYISLDNVQEGFLIIDLANLPNSNLDYYYWQPAITINGNTSLVRSTHTVSMTEDGFLLLNGTNINEGETLIFSLANDPYHPEYLGHTQNNNTGTSYYCHDSFSRNDTLWSSDIYNGWFSVYDIHDKANPQFISTQTTPMNFTHNSWLSDDSKTLFTTDEREDSWIAAYDVSDLSDIKEIDRWRRKSTEGTGVIIHNVHVLNDFIVTAHYTDGVTIVDGHRPNNLVEVANYDTYPQAGTGFDGVWGVYPYYTSGLIIASDISNGLFVFQPTYIRACYLEGQVTDAASGNPLTGVSVQIVGSENTTTDLSGNYALGQAAAGNVQVQFSKSGYSSQTINATLINGEVTIANVQLGCNGFSASGKVIGNGATLLNNAKIKIYNATSRYDLSTDINGNYNVSCIPPGVYNVYASKWGYSFDTLNNVSINQTLVLPDLSLLNNYYDDFELDLGWTKTSTAGSGAWEIGEPVGTDFNGQICNPNNDAADYGDQCYITGNDGGQAGTDDVDSGIVTLISPEMDFTPYVTPYIHLFYWFFNAGGDNNPNDSLVIKITNGVVTETLGIITTSSSSWHEFNVYPTIEASNQMRVFFVVSDNEDSGHLVEAGIDSFFAGESILESKDLSYQHAVKYQPNPFTTSISAVYKFDKTIDATVKVFNALGQIVEQKKYNNLLEGSLNMGEQWESGLYFIAWYENGQIVHNQKVIKE